MAMNQVVTSPSSRLHERRERIFSPSLHLVQIVTSVNEFLSRRWNREFAVRYVFKLGNFHIEASFFRHFFDSIHVKDVIELPISYGCPIGCRHCASFELSDFYPLTKEDVLRIFDYLVRDQVINTETPFRVAFAGIGEGALNRRVLFDVCKEISSTFSSSEFIFSTVGFDPTFMAFVEELSQDIRVKYFQVSYLHYDQWRLSQIVPSVLLFNADFAILVSVMKKIRNLALRLNYVVIRGFNDSVGHAKEVATKLEGMQEAIIIRISRLNETAPSARAGIYPTSISALEVLRDAFIEEGFRAYVFASARNDGLNCGQLVGDYLRRLRATT